MKVVNIIKNYFRNIDYGTFLFNVLLFFITMVIVHNGNRKHYLNGVNDGIEVAFDTINKILKVAHKDKKPISIKIEDGDTYILRRKDLIKTLND